VQASEPALTIADKSIDTTGYFRVTEYARKRSDVQSWFNHLCNVGTPCLLVRHEEAHDYNKYHKSVQVRQRWSVFRQGIEIRDKYNPGIKKEKEFPVIEIIERFEG
jgi:glutamate/tyrosine decarboxylase-like PLP-dependent enzyme